VEEMSQINSLPIGIFDSGVGGISVLAEIIKFLPNENFIYYADSKHAPYGIRNVDEVKSLSLDITHFLVNQGIKALVVACNTATSVAINHIRQELEIPVIGMEPALKPAVEMGSVGKIVVMATPMTLKEAKFNSLLNKYRDISEIISLPCPGLVEIIEAGYTKGEKVENYLKELFSTLPLEEISTLVLGCTHYLFVKRELQELLGPRIVIVDGNNGTAKNLKRNLEGQSLINIPTNNLLKTNILPNVQYFTSGDETLVIPLCKRLLKASL
jgi:glutamate racemase